MGMAKHVAHIIIFTVTCYGLKLSFQGLNCFCYNTAETLENCRTMHITCFYIRNMVKLCLYLTMFEI